jgi:hypothetical protein
MPKGGRRSTSFKPGVLALRRRADRQAKIAEAGTMLGDRGVVIGHARPPAARRELADIGNILEATIRFSGIENEGTRK